MQNPFKATIEISKTKHLFKALGFKRSSSHKIHCVHCGEEVEYRFDHLFNHMANCNKTHPDHIAVPVWAALIDIILTSNPR